MFSKRVNTKILPEVQEVLDQVKPIYNGRQPYTTSVKEWLKPTIDLDRFFVYPTNGATGAIDWWTLNEKRGVYKALGDYEWVDNNGTEVLYISCPNSIDGNYIDIPTDVPVILDIAYVGSTELRYIDVPKNVEKVFYSLSKPFGIHNIRTGWLFTRRPDIKLHSLNYDAGYYNYYANQLSEAIFNNFSIDYCYHAWKKRQLEVCEEYNLTPSDCVWLATSTDEKYKDYRRNDKVARICISDLF
jgi:hypothetical protein